MSAMILPEKNIVYLLVRAHSGGSDTIMLDIPTGSRGPWCNVPSRISGYSGEVHSIFQFCGSVRPPWNSLITVTGIVGSKARSTLRSNKSSIFSCWRMNKNSPWQWFPYRGRLGDGLPRWYPSKFGTYWCMLPWVRVRNPILIRGSR